MDFYVSKLCINIILMTDNKKKLLIEPFLMGAHPKWVGLGVFSYLLA